MHAHAALKCPSLLRDLQALHLCSLRNRLNLALAAACRFPCAFTDTRRHALVGARADAVLAADAPRRARVEAMRRARHATVDAVAVLRRAVEARPAVVACACAVVADAMAAAIKRAASPRALRAAPARIAIATTITADAVTRAVAGAHRTRTVCSAPTTLAEARRYHAHPDGTHAHAVTSAGAWNEVEQPSSLWRRLPT